MSSKDGLPNVWHLYNLRESPFFQDTLRAADGARYPIELFVGRRRDVARMLRAIGGSGSSRQVIAGAPGIGKTTLAQRIKADATAAGYLSHGEAVHIEAGMDTGALLVALLGHVYEAVVAAGGQGFDAEPVQTARQLVRSFRLKSGSASVSLLGVGAGGGVSTQVVSAGLLSASLVVPPLLRALVELAQGKLGAHGIVVHLNNFENLADSDRERAATTMRDIRDLLLLPGYHYLMVGTAEALHAVIDPHAQVRSVFGLFEELPPLRAADFDRLLDARYAHLRLDDARPALPPVGRTTSRMVYGLFHGDLRGALRALDIAAQELVGYADPVGAPMDRKEVMSVLAPRYATEMRQRLGDTNAGYLLRLAELEEPFTQQRMAATWKIAKGTTSDVAGALTRLGYLELVARTGRTLQYRRTGAARLALGLADRR